MVDKIDAVVSLTRPVAITGSMAAFLLSVLAVSCPRLPISKANSYRVGYNDAHPYYSKGSDGKPEGFAYEALDEAASRKGLKLEWVHTQMAPDEALGSGFVDIWPRMARNGERSGRFHITEPWLQLSFCLLVPRKEGGRWIRHQQPRTLSMEDRQSILAVAAKYYPDMHQVLRPTIEQAAEAVCSGEAEAGLFEYRTGMELVMGKPPGCRNVDLLPIPLDKPPVAISLASTLAAADGADGLRLELERMWEDGTLPTLQAKWFHEAPSEMAALLDALSARRMTTALWVGITALSAALALAILQAMRARRASKTAEHASRAKSEFVANISHEIRTPMNGVLGMTALLAESTLDGQQKEMVDTIQMSASSLLTVLNDILDFSKIEAGKLTIEKMAFDPRLLVDGVAALMRVRAKEKGISLVAFTAPEVPQRVVGDPARIRQILTNLVSNAIKFTAEGGVRLSVEVEPDPELERVAGGLRFSVEDTGIGIHREAAARLFRPFSQADSATTRKFGGTGLGLVISRQLARLMGGDLQFVSQTGKGSVFWLTLPLELRQPGSRVPATETGHDLNRAVAKVAAAPVVPPVAPPARVVKEVLAPPPLEVKAAVDVARNGQAKEPVAEAATGAEEPKEIAASVPVLPVLVVEDHPVNARVAQRMLQKQGYDVVLAQNGREGVMSFRLRQYALVIMDIQMPEMDGWEATAEIRAYEREFSLPRTPIVALTASAMEEDRRRSLRAGMDDFLSKPLQPGQLARVVEHWVHAGQR